MIRNRGAQKNYLFQ